MDTDGIHDGDEDWTHNGARGPGESDSTDTDTDDDGASDGDELLLSDLLDPDTDDDELLAGLDLFSPVTLVSDHDSDDDSIPDPAFRNVAQRTLIVNTVQTIERYITSGNCALALSQLRSLRQRVDGCGSAADSTDWLIDCIGQRDRRIYPSRR